VRISVGKTEHTAQMLAALRETLAELGVKQVAAK